VGEAGLGRSAIRALAERYGVTPTKARGQHFLVDPNLARAIVGDAGVGHGDRVVEVGAGFGSLTLPLAAIGADVLAIEFDRGLVRALEDVIAISGWPVRVLHADAMRLDWHGALDGDGWVLCANLPYSIGTPLVLDVLERVPDIGRLVVMVQREAGERLVARPGDDAYGAASLRVAYRASGGLVRRVPPDVFWPRPTVASVIVRLERRARPPVEVDEASLWRVVDAGFAERRKTMRNALRRLGLTARRADEVLMSSGVAPDTRPEQLDLEAFANLARTVGP
jgi:16S rRNA (adenine1518-N6/adenine1519-N6)-dimethyltransferase